MQTMSPSNVLVILCFPFLVHIVSPVDASSRPQVAQQLKDNNYLGDRAAGVSMAATPTLAPLKTSQPKPTPNSEGASVRPKPAKVEVVRGTTFYYEESYKREIEYPAQNMDANRRAVPNQTPEIQSSVNDIDYKNAGEAEDYFVADYENMEYFYEDLAPDEKKAEGVDMLQFLEDFLEESETVTDTIKSEEQMQEIVKEHYAHEVKVDKEVKMNEKISVNYPEPTAEPVTAAETVKSEEQLQEIVKEKYSHEVKVDKEVKMNEKIAEPATAAKTVKSEEQIQEHYSHDVKVDKKPVSVHLHDEDKPEIQLRNDDFQEKEFFQSKQIQKDSQWDFNELTEEEFLNDEFWDGKSDTEIVQLILKYSHVSPEDLQALFPPEQGVEYSKFTPPQDMKDTPINHELFLDDSLVSYNEDLVDEKLNSIKVSEGVPLIQKENVPLKHEQTTKSIQPNNELLSNDDSVDVEHNQKQIPDGVPVPHGKIVENISVLHEQTPKDVILEVPPKEHDSEDEKQIPDDVPAIHEQSLVPVSINNEQISKSMPLRHDKAPDNEPIIHDQSSEHAVDKNELFAKTVPNVSTQFPGDMSHNQDQLLQGEQDNQEQVLQGEQHNQEQLLQGEQHNQEHVLQGEQQNHEQIPEDATLNLKQIPQNVLHMMDALNLELAPEKQESVDVELRRKQIVDGIQLNHEQVREDALLDHEHLSTNIETNHEQIPGDKPHDPEFLSEDIEISNEEIPGEGPAVQKRSPELIQPFQGQLVEEQILADVLQEDVELKNNDPLSNEQIPGDVPLHHEQVLVDLQHVHMDLEANLEEVQMDSEFFQKQLSEEASLSYEQFLEEMTENVINVSDEAIENQTLILELTKLESGQNEDVFTAIQQHKQRLKTGLPEKYNRSNLKAEPKVEEENIKNHERMLREAEHSYSEPDTNVLAPKVIIESDINQGNSEQEKAKEPFVPQMDKENHKELNWDAEERVVASIFTLDEDFELEQQYPELKEDNLQPNLELIGLQYSDHHESHQDSEFLKINNGSKVFQDEIVINAEKSNAPIETDAFESDIKLAIGKLEPRLELLSTLEVESEKMKINPELEMTITPFNPKDSVKNENASNVAVKPAESQQTYESTDDLHLTEKGFVQNDIKENLHSADENSTSIQDEQSQTPFAGEKDPTLINPENDKEGNPVLIDSFQLSLESIETTSPNVQLTKDSLPIIGQESDEQQRYFKKEETSISLANSPEAIQDTPSNSVSLDRPLDSASTHNSRKLSIGTIDADSSLEQLPVSNMATFENSSLLNDSIDFSPDSPDEIDLVPGELLHEDKGPSIVNDDKHDEDEYVEWLMQFVPSSLHSWSHGLSYSTMFGSVSGDRVVLLLIVAVSFLVIFVVNQFLIVSNREKPLIARIAQMDKKLFSTTKALEHERVELCEAKLQCENQCNHVQQLNEKCKELEEELNVVRMEKADAVDKSIKAEKMLSESLLQTKTKEDAGEEDHREQLVGLVSELQAQSEAHKTLLDKYESTIQKKEKELKNIQKVNKLLKEDVEMTSLEMNKARTECLEFKAIIDQHLDNDTYQKNTIELVQTQLMDKDSSLERMEAELRTLRDRLVTFENEDEIKNSSIEELQQMLIIMEESGMGQENQDSTLQDVKELAKLRLRERENAEGELKEDIFDAKEKLAQVEMELSKVKKENECIRVTRDEAARKEEDAISKLDVLTEFFKKKESELLKELSLQSVRHDGVPADSKSLQEKLLSVSNELEATKESLKSATGELEVQAENHNVSRAEQEKKSYENWVAARQAERNVARAEGEMRVLRNRLTIAESRNSELLEAIKANPVDAKIKMELVVNNKPNADNATGTEFQPIEIDLPPLPGFTGHRLPLPGILSLPNMSVPTILPPNVKDARPPSLRRRSQRESLSQYSSCPGSPRTAPNHSSSWYRSESRSPSSSRPQSNSPFQGRAEESRSPYRTESRSSYRADSRSPYREKSQSSHRADSRSSHRADSRSQYIGKSRSPNREDSRSQYMAETRSPQRANSRSQYMGESRSPQRADSHSPYKAESRSPYKVQSRSPSRISSEPLCPSDVSNQRADIQPSPHFRSKTGKGDQM